MFTDGVKTILAESMWDLATVSNDGEVNVVPVAFKSVAEDGKLLVGDVFMETTVRNVKENGKIAISAFNAQTLEGYQIKGTAEYITEGEIVDTFKGIVEKTFNGAATAKGALVITPAKCIITTPGGENKNEL